MFYLYYINDYYDGGYDNISNWLFDRKIYVSSQKIIVGNNYFKVGNYVLKKNGKDFQRIAIEARKRGLWGPYLFI